MRKEIYRMPEVEAIARLSAARVVHLCGLGADGGPVLRSLHPIVLDRCVYFHGAPAGEKQELVGTRAIVSTEEVVASIPSYFVDAERACPATTYYRSVQAHGVISAVRDPVTKARVLQAFMEKFQREGGHVPITAEGALYRRAIEGISVLCVPIDQLDGKAKLGQNRTPPERRRILESLWQSTLPFAPAAIEAVRAANPETPLPSFLAPPPFIERPMTVYVDLFDLACGPTADPRVAGDLAALLGCDESTAIARHRQATAWVGACDANGRLIATARAVSDRVDHAILTDVAVDDAWRGSALDRHLVTMLRDHPAVRGARRVEQHG